MRRDRTIIYKGEEITMSSGVQMSAELIDYRDEYAEFLATKALTHVPSGLSRVDKLPSIMFPHQRDVTEWIRTRGRARRRRRFSIALCDVVSCGAHVES